MIPPAAIAVPAVVAHQMFTPVRDVLQKGMKHLYKWITTKITGTWEFGYEESYSSARLRNLVRRAGLQVVETFGLQVLPPLATNRSEAMSLKFRKKIMKLNKLFPSSAWYAYGTGVVCKKV